MPDSRPHRRGTAFIEILVIIGIVGMLIAILIPMFMSARQRSTQFKCANNLRELGRGMFSYAATNHGRFPSTRPSVEPQRKPDLSNSGYAATQPFAIDGPSPNNVPAAMFLLIRSDEVSAQRFVCPNTLKNPDQYTGASAQNRSNFSDVGRNLTYGMHNPYASESVVTAGFKWGPQWLPDTFPLMADMGPAPLGLFVPSPSNSPNHDFQGQNILFADGSVDFRTTPLSGVDQDHIYRTRSGSIFDSQSDPSDAILLPIQQ